jgi:transcriptional regulator with XRE-family HTH domain
VRELIGETQRGLAEGVGVTPQYMNRIEAGRVETISADLFARIVRVMRLTDRRALLADPHPAPVADRVAA